MVYPYHVGYHPYHHGPHGYYGHYGYQGQGQGYHSGH